MVLSVLQLCYPAWLYCSSSWPDILSETILGGCSFWELPSHVLLLFVCLGLWWWLCLSRCLKVFLWFLNSVWRGDEIWSGDIGLCNLLSVDPERYCYIVFYTYFGVQESNAVVLVNFIHGCWLFRWPRNKSTLRSSIWQIFHQHVDDGLANVFGFKTLHEEFSCKTWCLGTNS